MDKTLSIVLESVFSGTAVYFISTWCLGMTQNFIEKFWLRPYGKAGGRAFLWRIKAAIFLGRFSRFYLTMANLLSLVAWMLIFKDLGNGLLIAFAHIAGFWFIPVLMDVQFVRKTLPRFSLMMAVTAAKRLVAHAPEASVQSMLKWAAAQPYISPKIAAVNGYMEVTEAWAFHALEQLSKSEYLEVAAAAKEAAIFVHAAVYGSGPRSLHKMNTLMAEYEKMTALLSRQVGRTLEKKELLAAAGTEIDDLVYSQLKLKEGFPHLYCVGCLARSETVNFHEWEWVRCKRCHDVLELRTGIEQVVGEIGGLLDRNQAGGVLQINLWDATTRQAILAEVDALHIVGGKEIDYDWAINAVVQKLHDQSAKHSPDIPVRMTGEVPLSQNSRHLLQALNPSGKF